MDASQLVFFVLQMVKDKIPQIFVIRQERHYSFRGSNDLRVKQPWHNQRENEGKNSYKDA